MELQAQHTVTDVPQAGGTVLGHRPAGPLDVLEQQHPVRAGQVLVVTVEGPVLPPPAVLAVKGTVADVTQQVRHGQAVGLEAADKPAGADLVDQFERPEFPVVTETHGGIDGGDIVADIGGEPGGVTESPGDHPPAVAPAPVIVFEERPKAALLGRRDTVQFWPAGVPDIRRYPNRGPA